MEEIKTPVRSFKFQNKILDIPVSEVDDFLSKAKGAEEVRSFTIGKDTLDIPLMELPDFVKNVPNAMPLYQYPEYNQQAKQTELDTLKTQDEADQDYFNNFKEIGAEPKPLNKPDESGWKGFGKELGYGAVISANTFNKMLANTPDFLNRVAAWSLNNSPLGKVVESTGKLFGKDIQLVRAGDGRPEKINEKIDKNIQYWTDKVADVNSKHEQGIIESAKNGDWVTFARNLGRGVTESFAPSVAMMLTGGYMSAPAMIGAGAAIFGAGKLEEYDKYAPEMSEDTKIAAALTNGALEGIFETYLGSGAVGKAFKNILTKEGRDAGKNVIMHGLRNGFSDLITKYPALTPFGEGFEEWGTQVAQNFVDKVSGYKPDVNIFEGSTDAFLIGVGAGASHTAPLYLAKGATGLADKMTGGDKAQVPTISPRDTYQSMMLSDIQGLAHESGEIITIKHANGKILFAKQGDLNDPDGVITVVDENGKSDIISTKHVVDFARSSIDMALKAKMAEYDFLQTQQQQQQQIAQQQIEAAQDVSQWQPGMEVSLDNDTWTVIEKNEGKKQWLLSSNTTGVQRTVPVVEAKPESSKMSENVPQNEGMPPDEANKMSKYPVNEKGEPDIDNMDEEQLFFFNKEKFGEETALSDLAEDIKLITNTIAKNEKKIPTVEGKAKTKLRLETQQLTEKKQRLEGLLPKQEEPVKQVAERPITEEKPVAAPVVNEEATVEPENIYDNIVNNRPDIEYESVVYDETVAGKKRRVSGKSNIIDISGRKVIVVNINGRNIPFYLSTGHGGKKDVASGKWYPFFGLSEDGWFNKLSGEQINNYYGSSTLRYISESLDKIIGDIRNDDTIPKVTLNGKHKDFINRDLNPTENETSETIKNVNKNIADVVSFLETVNNPTNIDLPTIEENITTEPEKAPLETKIAEEGEKAGIPVEEMSQKETEIATTEPNTTKITTEKTNIVGIPKEDELFNMVILNPESVQYYKERPGKFAEQIALGTLNKQQLGLSDDKYDEVFRIAESIYYERPYNQNKPAGEGNIAGGSDMANVQPPAPVRNEEVAKPTANLPELTDIETYGKFVETKAGIINLVVEPNENSPKKNSIKITAYLNDKPVGISSANIEDGKLKLNIADIKIPRKGIYTKMVDEWEDIANKRGLKLVTESGQTEEAKAFWTNRNKKEEGGTENAIPIKTTGQVPVQSGTGGSQTVEEGKPQPKPEEVTPEGKPEEVNIDNVISTLNSAQSIQDIQRANNIYLKLPDEVHKDKNTAVRYKDAINQANKRIKKAEDKRLQEEIKNRPKPPRPEEPDNDWISNYSDDPEEIYRAFNNEKENTPESLLSDKERYVLGYKITPESWNLYGDRNKTSSAIARAWFTNKKDKEQGKGKPIDILAHEFGEDERLTPQEIVEIILKFPNKNVRKTTDVQNMLRKRYRDVTGKSIDNHVITKNEPEVKKKLDNFLKTNKLENDYFDDEDLLKLIEENKDKLPENDYIAIHNFVEDEIRRYKQSATEWDDEGGGQPEGVGRETYEDENIGNEEGIPEVTGGETEETTGTTEPTATGIENQPVDKFEQDFNDRVKAVQNRIDAIDREIPAKIKDLEKAAKNAQGALFTTREQNEKLNEEYHQKLKDLETQKEKALAENTDKSPEGVKAINDRYKPLFNELNRKYKPRIEQQGNETPIDLTKENVVKILQPLRDERAQKEKELSDLMANHDRIVKEARDKQAKVEEAQGNLFDFGKLFNQPQEDVKPSSVEEQREEAYKNSSFDKKWAGTYKEARQKLIDQYNKAKTDKETWENKKYKTAGDATVFVGGELEGQDISIDRINNKRRQDAINNAQSDMDIAIKDMRLLGLTNNEISEITQQKTDQLPLEKKIEDEGKKLEPEKPAKQPWEMTRDEYVGEGYVFSQTDRALNMELNKWKKIKDEADKEKYNIDAVNQAIANVQRKIERSNEHRKSVEQAFNEGKIDSHPDYPELTKTKQKEAWEMTLSEFLQDSPYRFDGLKNYKNETLAITKNQDGTFDVINSGGLTLVKHADKYAAYDSARREVGTNIEHGKQKHKEIVQQALSEGKPIPENVLNDYPELKKESLQKEPETPYSVRDLANMQEGQVSAAVFSALEKGTKFKVGRNKTYTVISISKDKRRNFTDKKGNERYYDEVTYRIEDDKGNKITSNLWKWDNGNSQWTGTNSNNKHEGLSRDIEGDINVDLINEYNPLHDKSDSYKLAEQAILKINEQENRKQQEQPKDEKPEPVKEYRYKMLLRPFDIGTYPKEGFVKAENDPEGGFQILTYNRKLTPKEYKHASFLPLTEIEEIQGKSFTDKDGYYSNITLDWLANKQWAKVSMYDQEGKLVEQPFDISVNDILENVNTGYWKEKQEEKAVDKNTPERIPVIGIGDLHGENPEILAGDLMKAGITKDGVWQATDKTVVQIGDVTDRGESSRQLITVLDNLQKQAKAKGGEFVRILGNHDLFHIMGKAEQLGGKSDEIITAKLREAVERGDIVAAWAEGDTIYTHAGIDLNFFDEYATETLTPKQIADSLNTILKNAVKNNDFGSKIFDTKNGIFWTRGDIENDLFRQVVGHTVKSKEHTYKNGDRVKYIDTGRIFGGDRSLFKNTVAEPYIQKEKQELKLESPESVEKLEDFGEKVGGARKDMGITRTVRDEDSLPAWRRKYFFSNADGTMVIGAKVDTSKPFIVQYSVEVKSWNGKHDVPRPVTAINSRTPKIFNSEQEAEDYIPIFEVWKQKYNVRKRGDNYVVTKTSSTGKVLEFESFPTEEEANAYMYSTEGATSLLNHKREDFSIPALDKVERTGKNYRNGRDISTDEFMNTFGFRGGEFGNWVKPEERRVMLNAAYDSFMDLAEILGIPPKAVSLSGNLSIAFGARGVKGAKAHFEADRAVINLTRMNGAGSLAHEWAHAVDNYFGLQESKKGYERNEKGEVKAGRIMFSEDRIYTRGMRKELSRAFQNIIDALQQKTVTRTMGVEEKQKTFDNLQKSVQRESEALLNKFENGILTYQYNRKTKQREEVRLKATPEQLEKAKELIGKIVNGEGATPVWGTVPGSSNTWGHISPETIALNELYKEVFGRTGFGKDAGRIHNFGYYASRMYPAKEILDKAKIGESETLKVPTDYLKVSKEFDKTRVQPYFAKNVELFARAFEYFIETKLEENKVKSDYLQYDKAPVYDAIYGKNPYPAGEERTELNRLFQEFFNEVKVKEEDGRQIMYRAVSPIGYYSTVENALDKITQAKGTPEQFKAMLLKNGAKQAEMDWMDFDGTFTGKSVTKQDIQDWIDQNRIEVREVVKDDKNPMTPEFERQRKYVESLGYTVVVEPNEIDTFDLVVIDKDGYNVLSEDQESNPLSEEHANAINRLDDLLKYSQSDGTRYGQYYLLGGKNYKELLLTMPVNYKPLKKADEAQTKYVQMLEEKYGQGWGTKATPEEVSEAKRLWDEADRLYIQERNTKFTQSHWDEPNVLAHVRFDERTTPEGEKVLFIEEIQSDWAQKGKKEGFIQSKVDWEQRLSDFNKRMTEKYQLDKYYPYQRVGKRDELMNEDERSELQDISSHREIGKVPNMPFKSTDQWVNLTLRRMMRYASENGFDRIAWTTGEQQADRYDLSKRVDTIRYSQEEGKLWIYSIKDNSFPIVKQYNSENELSEIIGKELARKIYNNEGKITDIKGIKELSGLDLKVGGEGMKAFYDQIIPSAANKLGKPFGAKVEPVVLGEKASEYEGVPLEDIERYGKQEGVNKLFISQSIPVTPQMVESTLAGIPLFRPTSEGVNARTDSEKAITDKINEIQSRANNARPLIIARTEKELLDQLEQYNIGKNATEAIVNHFNKPNVSGFYDPITKTAVINPIKLNNREDAVATWLHEMGIHAGLENILPKGEFNRIMEEVYDFIRSEAEKNPQYQSILDNVENNPLYSNASKATKGEELLAYLGETRGEKATYADRSLWRKVMDYIRKALAKIFGVRSLPMTHETIQNLIDASIQSNFQRTGRPGEGVEGRSIRDAIAGITGAARLDRADEATTRLMDLRKAKDMERQNKDAKTIKYATGWERGAGGKWRYEIQDNLQIIKEFPEIGENDYEFSNFTDYFNDDVLQNAYPELGKAKVLFVNENNNIIAAYSQEARIIKVNINEKLLARRLHRLHRAEGSARIEQGGNDRQLNMGRRLSPAVADIYKKAVIHEVQHFIQDIEGFQRGTNTEDIQRIYPELVDRELADNMGLEGAISNEDYNKTNITDSQIKRRNEAAFSVYKKSAGEVEGRNAENRFGYTEEQRRQTLLEETEDVARKDQLFLRNSLGISQSQPFLDDLIEGSEERAIMSRAANAMDNASERYGNELKKEDAKTFEKVSEFLQDKALPLKRQIAEVLRRGGKVHIDPFKLMKNAPGRMQTLYEEFYSDKMEPLLETFAKIVKSKVPESHIVPYLIAKHALERNPYLRAKKLSEWIKQYETKEGEKPTQDQIDAQMDKLKAQDFSGIMEMDTKKDFDGRPDDFAQELVNLFEKECDHKLLTELHTRARVAARHILDVWKNNYSISDSEYNEYLTRFSYFMPLRGWREDQAKRYTYSRGEGRKPSLQYAEGRKSMAENPLAYIIKTTYQAIGEQVDGEVKRAMLNVVAANREQHDLFNLKRAYFVKAGIDPTTGEQLWDMTHDRPPKAMFDSGDAESEFFKEHMRLRTPAHSREHEVDVKTLDGMFTMVFEGNSLPVAQVLNNKNYVYINPLSGRAEDARELKLPLFDSIQKITRIMKMMFTQLNVVFPVTNLTRDTIEGAITQSIKGGSGLFMISKYPDAFNTVSRHLIGKPNPKMSKLNAEYKKFKENGGTTGYTHDLSVEEYERHVNKQVDRILNAKTVRGRISGAGRKLINGISIWNQTFEDGVRFSVYLEARNRGMSVTDACFESRNATVDFNTTGKGTKFFENIWLFFKVSMNSLAKNSDLFINKKTRNRAITAAASFAMIGFLEALLNYSLDDDDDKEDDYYNISQWMRHNYLILPWLGKDNNYISVALPQFWRGFKSLGSIAFDVMVGQTDVPKALGQAVGNFAGSLTPIDLGGFYHDGEFSLAPVIPTAFRPFYEVYGSNRNYMGIKIAREPFTKHQEEVLANHGLAKDNVGVASKFFSDVMFRWGGGDNETKYYVKNGKEKKIWGILDINPSRIDHLVGSYTGGTGRFVGNVIKTATQVFGDEEFDFRNAPFVNAFIRKTPESKWKVIEKYQAVRDEVEYRPDLRRAYKKQAETGSKEGIERYSEFNSNVYYNRLEATVNNYEKMIDDISDKVDWNTAEGSERITDLMQRMIDETDKLKNQYR